ncbi:MAG TPA: hypothetical protein VGX68_21470 [Thermoanaerobaculia bacterium]|jgi:hypothetical protein|nr:hypothetical protein [Thermoanaerobaculia bacterium]
MRYSETFRIVSLTILLAAAASVTAHAACGEASCVAAQGVYISHFTGANCDGTESYYLPYDGYAYQCRPWDGVGNCGTIRRTVSNRSYRYNGVCYANAWPNGNPLSDFVTVYRDKCGEANCVNPQASYISHYTGPNCDGAESYYLPYDGYGFQCRPWDGAGVCGTLHRTMTHRSYRYNGTCYANAWPSGNTLRDFVAVYRSNDVDKDGLPDSLETALAQRFFPVLNLHCGTFEGLAYGDRRQLYGLTVSGYTNSSRGRIPFSAHPYNPGNGNCSEPFQCIEIRYGIAWNWDLGDDFFGGSHRGDSEMYGILVARKDTDGADWGVSWIAAQNNASQWRLIKEFMSAHWNSGGESSSYRSHGNSGTTTVQRVWCAEGKHAMYPTQNACNNGNAGDIDDCGDNRCDITTEVFLKVQNAGEPTAAIDPYLLYPGSSKTVEPSGTYNIWSGAAFGEATSYKANLTQALSWCPVKCY